MSRNKDAKNHKIVIFLACRVTINPGQLLKNHKLAI